MKFETLELVKQDKIATITFNRPELLNAVNEQFIWDFQKATSDAVSYTHLTLPTKA